MYTTENCVSQGKEILATETLLFKHEDFECGGKMNFQHCHVDFQIFGIKLMNRDFEFTVFSGQYSLFAATGMWPYNQT